MFLINLFSVVLVVVYFGQYGSGTNVVEVLPRQRRQLLFPNSTVLQFNAGIGTPSPAKNVGLNFAFQANFQLPWNRTQIPVDILHSNSGYDGESRRKRDLNEDYKNDAKLVHFYKYVEELLVGFGLNGKSCVEQTLCHIGAEPLHSHDDEDLLHELATFVLNPTNDGQDENNFEEASKPYVEAYRRGQRSEDCKTIYSNCNFPLIDMFTQLHVQS